MRIFALEDCSCVEMTRHSRPNHSSAVICSSVWKCWSEYESQILIGVVLCRRLQTSEELFLFDFIGFFLVETIQRLNEEKFDWNQDWTSKEPVRIPLRTNGTLVQRSTRISTRVEIDGSTFANDFFVCVQIEQLHNDWSMTFRQSLSSG